MNVDRQRRYDSMEDFFDLEGSVVMKLTPDAAIAVCKIAAERGFVVLRVEGGIWRCPGFEARLDCIWDGRATRVSLCQARGNNQSAAEFIRSEAVRHDAFIITVDDIEG